MGMNIAALIAVAVYVAVFVVGLVLLFSLWIWIEIRRRDERRERRRYYFDRAQTDLVIRANMGWAWPDEGQPWTGMDEL